MRRTARTAAFVATAGAVVIGFFLDDWVFPSLFVLATGPLMIVVSHPRLPYSLRLAFVLGTMFGVGALFLMRYSYPSPGAVAMLAQTVFLGGLFGGRRLAFALLLVTTSCFVVGGALWPHLDTAESLREMRFDDASNWFRIAVVLPLVLLVNGHTVLDVFRLAADRIATLDRARRELDHRQQQHQAETDALVRAEAMRGRAERPATAGRLTGVVAHDLNNSLMTPVGWAELLDHSETPDEALQNLEQASEHAEALLQPLRGTTELEHRGAGLDLGLALGRARPMLDAVWQLEAAQRCTLTLHSDSGCFVAIQEGSFRRLVVNLVTNARHALGTRPGSCDVRIELTPLGVNLSVGDTGPGMDPATRERIFEPFFTTKPEHGTGLGFLSVSEIVRATAGTLEVRSEPGVGSTFAIHWALAEPGTAKVAEDAPAASIGGSTRVLLVEDEPAVRRLLARGLRSQGYDVVEAEDGDAATRRIHESGRFDALCTDAVMPGRSVSDLIRDYQATHARGLVLVISGYFPESLAPLLNRAGVGLLRKPFSHARLGAELERLRQTRV